MNFINKKYIQEITGWDSAYFLDAIREYISKTGKIDLHVSPKDYIELICNMPAQFFKSGRTEDNLPFLDYYGIHIIMISNEEAQKYEILL